MKKLLISITIIVLAVLILYFHLAKSQQNISSVQEVSSPVLIKGGRDLTLKRQDRYLHLKTSSSRALVGIKGAHFLVEENSEAVIRSNSIFVRTGQVEVEGKASIKIKGISWSINGKGILSRDGMVCCKGYIRGRKTLRPYQLYKGETLLNLNPPPQIKRLQVKGNRVEIYLSGPGELEVAKDPFFVNVVIKKAITGSFDVVNLPNGVYYVRSRSLESLCPGKAKKFTVKELQQKLREIDKTPPLLKASITAKGRVVIIKGQTEIGVKLFVNDVEVDVDSKGNFYYTLTFDRLGEYKITLKAIDEAGNVSRLEKTVLILGE